MGAVTKREETAVISALEQAGQAAVLVQPLGAATKREEVAASSALKQAGEAAPGSEAPRVCGDQHMTAEIGGHAQQGMSLSNLPAVATEMRRLRQSRSESAMRRVSTRIHCQRPLFPAHWILSSQG